jgi:hypothetical protein
MTTAQLPKVQFEARNLLRYAATLGIKVEVHNTQEAFGRPSADAWLVTASRTFEPGSASLYVASETDALTILGMVPMVRPGTVWGTTSDGVGGHAGMIGGYVRINKSGVSANLCKALRKLGA